jgi:hypothetical protein
MGYDENLQGLRVFLFSGSLGEGFSLYNASSSDVIPAFRLR